MNNYSNSTASSSTTFEYSILENENPSGTGNIDATIANFNPLFTDLVNDDFTLQANSPLIDSGLNSYNSENSDLIGNVRIHNNTIDIGAYEYGATVLNTPNVLSDTIITIFKSSENELSVINLEGYAYLSIYSISGKEIISRKSIFSNGNTSVRLPNNLSKGIFIIKLNSNTTTFSKKIIL